jgi:hypothetical protein
MKKTIGDLIIELHHLSRTIEDDTEGFRIRLLANELAKIGNRIHEKQYQHHFAILTSCNKFLEVCKYIAANNLSCEVHLNRTRFWVTSELLTDFLGRYGKYCNKVSEDENLVIGSLIHSDKEYEVASLEEAEAFAKKRNYWS